jgi:hypothetical protein
MPYNPLSGNSPHHNEEDQGAFLCRALQELLQIADQIDAVRGDSLNWDTLALGISQKAWDRVIHRGIRPIIIFAHPLILHTIPHSTGYYRTVAMVSQASMRHIGLVTAPYEESIATPNPQTAHLIARHLNNLISRLIETDEAFSARKFDLWRGLAVGLQAHVERLSMN